MFTKRSFKFKLLVLCFVLSSVSAVVGTISYMALRNVSEHYGEIVNENMPNLRDANDMYLAFRQIRISLRSLGLTGIEPDLAKDMIADVVKNIETYEKANKNYTATPFMPGEEALYKKVDQQWTDFKELGKKILALQKSSKPEDHEKMMHAFFYECPEIAGKFTAAMNVLLDFHKDSAAARSAETQGIATQANLWIFCLIFIGMACGMIVGWIFSSSVSKTLSKISSHLGDDANKLSQAATQISSASVNLSSATTQQAAAIQETTAAVEETSAMIAKNAENAKVSNDVSAQSQDTATKGHQAVTEMLHSIEEIAQSNNEIMQQIEQSNKEISDIVTVISEIGNKTKVINDIVFQTKLLSFNASVEAARAGEHGKGFAVVAEEVGNLAEMSGGAAKEISEMLENSIKKVEAIVSNTKTRVNALIASGKQKVEAGTETAKRCSESLEEIVANVSRVSGLVSEISTASDEQARGVAEINKAMSEMDNVAQQNSAASQQTSSSAESLNTQVQSLHQMIKELNGVISGGSASASAPVAAPSNVVAMPKPKAVAASHKPRKKVVGYDIPSANDPGFED